MCVTDKPDPEDIEGAAASQLSQFSDCPSSPQFGCDDHSEDSCVGDYVLWAATTEHERKASEERQIRQIEATRQRIRQSKEDAATQRKIDELLAQDQQEEDASSSDGGASDYDTNGDDDANDQAPYQERVDLTSYHMNERNGVVTVKRARRIRERVELVPEMLLGTSDLQLLFESGKRMLEEDRAAGRPKRQAAKPIRGDRHWSCNIDYTHCTANQAGQLIGDELHDQLWGWRDTDQLEAQYLAYCRHMRELQRQDGPHPPDSTELQALDDAVQRDRRLREMRNAVIERQQAKDFDT